MKTCFTRTNRTLNKFNPALLFVRLVLSFGRFSVSSLVYTTTGRTAVVVLCCVGCLGFPDLMCGNNKS